MPTIEERMEEMSFLATPFTINGKVIAQNTAIRIAKEYAEECCKLQLALVISQCRDKFYLLGDDAVEIHYLALRRTIETTKLATEEME